MSHLFFDDNGNVMTQCYRCDSRFRASENRCLCRRCERDVEYEPWSCGHCQTQYGPDMDWCPCIQEPKHQVFDDYGDPWQLVTPTYNTSLTFNHPFAFLDFLRFAAKYNEQSPSVPYFDAGTVSQEIYDMVMAHPVMQRKTRRTKELERRMRRLMNTS